MPYDTPFETRDMTGAIFHRKPDGNKPTWKGTIKVADVEYEIAGWERETKKGQPMISLKIKEKYQEPF